MLLCLRAPLPLGLMILLTSGCGSIGLGSLDEGEGVLASAGGSTVGDGDGDDAEGTGGKGSGSGGDDSGSGGQENATGGLGGSDGTGGEGTGGRFERPPLPCATDCIDPFLLYRTFEAGVPLGVKEDSGATVARSTEVVHQGQYSLATTQGEPETDAQITEYIRPIAGDHIYYRAFIYIPEGAITDWVKVLAFNAQGNEGIDVNIHAGGSLEIYSQISATSTKAETAVVPTGQWVCLEVHTYVDDFAGSVEVSIDDVLVASVEGGDTLPGTAVNNLVYGLAETGPEQVGATIYTDDILASTSPVSCEAGLL